MTDAYQVAVNWDNSGALATINPQPRGLGEIVPVEYGLDGSATVSGKSYMDLEWDVNTRAEFNTILTAFGMSITVRSKKVTVRIRLNDDTFANRNAIAQLQQPERDFVFWKRLKIRLNGLRSAS